MGTAIDRIGGSKLFLPTNFPAQLDRHSSEIDQTIPKRQQNIIEPPRLD